MDDRVEIGQRARVIEHDGGDRLAVDDAALSDDAGPESRYDILRGAAAGAEQSVSDPIGVDVKSAELAEERRDGALP